MRRTNLFHVPALAGSLALGLACASGPPPALQDAELAYRDAAADPEVVQYAPVALHEAEGALTRAREADEESEVEHRAYLAARRVEIAREEAKRAKALEAAEKLGEQQQVVAAEQRARVLELELETLRAQQTDRGIVINLQDVLFAVDRAELQPGVLPDLARLAEFLEQNPERPVLIEGHTDSTGSSQYNLRLSEARAQAVESVLVQQGVPPNRIDVRAFGESAPVASNDTAAGRQQNRRVEIVIANPPTVGAGPH